MMVAMTVAMAVKLMFPEVLKTILGSVLNGADPMVEWGFLLSGYSS